MKTEIETEDGGLFVTKTMGAAEVIKQESPDSPIVVLLSTATVDSDGDVVWQRKNKNGPGWVLDRFNKNPVVTWQHDIWVPSLSGPNTRAKVMKHETKGQALHLSPLTFDFGDEMAMTIEGKIRRDVLKEFSAGFKVLARDTIKNDEGRTTGLNIYGAELIEAAVANRGANPETEVIAKRLLTRPDLAAQVQGGGSAEVAELKAEIEDLSDQLEVYSNALKSLSDQFGEHEAMMAKETQQIITLKTNQAANELLKAVQKIGTAR